MSQSSRPVGELRYLGDADLRVICAPVEHSSPNLTHLVIGMKRIVIEHRASGLAANQIGGTVRVIIAGIRGKGYMTMVNPRIVGERGPLMLFTGEGCLSVPNFRTSTRRHAFVRVCWQDTALGAEQQATLADDDAQVIQHEIDHLDGKLIVDGLSRQQRRQAERCVFDFVARKAS